MCWCNSPWGLQSALTHFSSLIHLLVSAAGRNQQTVNKDILFICCFFAFMTEAMISAPWMPRRNFCVVAVRCVNKLTFGEEGEAILSHPDLKFQFGLFRFCYLTSGHAVKYTITLPLLIFTWFTNILPMKAVVTLLTDEFWPAVYCCLRSATSWALAIACSHTLNSEESVLDMKPAASISISNRVALVAFAKSNSRLASVWQLWLPCQAGLLILLQDRWNYVLLLPCVYSIRSSTP